jgi:CHC2-type zinc finger protein
MRSADKTDALISRSQPQEIADLVDMATLLRGLGFDVNERTHRAPCILHRGSNPTAFSWKADGRWHCFSCDLGGDKIALVRAVRQCSFREAMEFLAAMAGAEYRPNRISAHEIERARIMPTQAESNARALASLEVSAWRDAQNNLHSLLALRRNAAARLLEIEHGAPLRFPDEVEFAWTALQIVADQFARADAAYCIVSFAAPPERYAFVLHPERREEMIDTALVRGYVADEKGYRFEVAT